MVSSASLLTLSWVKTAQAQSPGQDEELFDDKRGDTAVDQDTLDQSEIAFFEGLTAYRAKKYQEAAEYFQKAYQLVPYRDLLFNVARSYEELKDQESAIKYYKMYLDTKPIDETQIIHRLRQLGVKDFRASQSSNKTPVTPTNPSLIPSAPSDSDQLLTWSTLGSGVALIAVGAYFGVDALDQASQAREATAQRKYQNFKSAAESSALWADVSMTLGLAAIAGGVYLLLINGDNSSPAQGYLGVVGTSPETRSEQRVQWRININNQAKTFGVSGSF